MEVKAHKFVAYYRVSTVEQQKSGLGLDAQKTAVVNYVKGQGTIIKEFTEIETGTKKRTGKEIQNAINFSKKEKAILIIAKLDRLARNVNFVSSLMESGVEFIACDMPTANNFTIHIFAALAEQETAMLVSRTKAALAELKAKGVKLGTPKNLTKAARKRGLEVRMSNARNHPANIKATAIAKLLKDKGNNLVQIADELNKLGYETRNKCKYRYQTISMLLKRA